MASKRTADKQHRWLSQVEVTGVVFSEPVLAEAAPAGFPNLDKKVLAQFHKAREIWNLPKGMVKEDPQGAWIRFILEEILRHRSTDWLVGAAIPAANVVNLPAQQETIRPTRVLVDGDTPVLLMLEVPRSQSLDRPWIHGSGRWKASPTTKLERLLRETGVELGLVTNGEGWRLIAASPAETASWLTWTATTWAESPLTLAAFRDLLGTERFFAGAVDQVPLELIRRSRERQLDVADQLGEQTRAALALFVHEFDRADREAGGNLRGAYSSEEIFQGGVAFIMRLLFLFYAEENGLLPHGSVVYDRSYGVLHLLTELEHHHRIAPEGLARSFSAYPRLLATFRMVFFGSVDPDIQIAGHGGVLFSPDRYPVLEGRVASAGLEPPRIADSVIRRVLRSLKYATANGARQLVSYRTLAVEQIGHMYEGLLDRTVGEASEALVLLRGTSKVPDPEPLTIDRLARLAEREFYKLVAKQTGRTAATLRKLLQDSFAATADIADRLEPLLLPHGRVPAGGLFVTKGEDRRSQGAHYTPPTLTEPIVREALQHHIYHTVSDDDASPRLRSPASILGIKVCDPAMGSGAFLVQTVRYLGERLVDSWELETGPSSAEPRTLPFALPAVGAPDETLMPESREDRLVAAKRLVAERCVYGVDLNPLAVEMAKLSLWLTTASANRPFTFLDHALRTGDSLVGLTRDQIVRFSWKPVSRDLGPLFSNIDATLSSSIEYRKALAEIPEHEYTTKKKVLTQAQRVAAKLRNAGDRCIQAFWDGETDQERESLRRRYREDAEAFRGASDAKHDARTAHRSEGTTVPFHWEIEFPEVFSGERRGFDAVIGNPPFLGGKRISTIWGKRYLEALALLRGDAKGAADLCAYFLLRAAGLLRSSEDASIGLITTNTIGQGDTREIGLAKLIDDGFKVYSARPGIRWPGKAAVTVSILHAARMLPCGRPRLDGRPVDTISAYLDAMPCNDTPPALAENEGLCGTGVYVYGKGFVLSNEEREQLVAADSVNDEVIRRYLVGNDINNALGSEPTRWCIDFGDRSLMQASAYAAVLQRLTETVKPVRDGLTGQIHESRYWIHWDRREEFFEHVDKLKCLFARSRVSNLHIVAAVDPSVLISDAVVIYRTDSLGHFAVLQSVLHEHWAERFSTTMKNDVRYSISDAFENFPFPSKSSSRALDAVGEHYLGERSRLAERYELTLRKLYNKLHDPDVADDEIDGFRELQVVLAQEVANAYGLEVDFDFDHRVAAWLPGSPVRYAPSPTIRSAYLTQLLELNRARAGRHR